MLRQSSRSLHFLSAISAALVLAGCAGAVPEYQEPPVATVAVNSSQARIVMRSAGMPMAVNFAVSDAPAMCEGFVPAGRVFHSGREKLLPWIATLTEKSRKAVSNELPQVEQLVEAGKEIKVKGYSGWADVSQNMRSSGSCGPLVSRFTPEAGKTYLVEFRFAGTRNCTQSVMEVGKDEQRVPVEKVVPLFCEK